MADSRRETILKAIEARLVSIIGGAGYARALKLKSVQRFVHEWKDESHIGNVYGEETIIVRAFSETSKMDGGLSGVGQWTNQLQVRIRYVPMADSANDTVISECLADMRRALFQSWEGMPHVTIVESISLMQLEDDRVWADGIFLILTLTYSDNFGDPTTGD